MSRESEVAAVLAADTTLDAILTGGVYSAEQVGVLGITRDTTPDAFDSDGFLQPTALVRQRGRVPFGDVRDLDAKVASSSQVVEVWFYEDTNYSAIDAAIDRVYTLLQGYKLPAAYPAEWIFTLDRMRDEGALENAAMARIDFQVRDIRQG